MKKAWLGLCLALITIRPAMADDVFDRVMKTKTINCGYFIWVPNITKDPNTGDLSGINYEIMEAIGQTLKLKIKWTTEVGPSDVATALGTNKIDVMCASMWPTPARFADVTYSNRPEFYSLVYPIVRANDTRFDKDLSKANNKDIKVTGFEGDVTADIAMEKLPKATHAFLGATASPADALLQLTTKKADMLFLDKGAVNEFSKTNPGLLKVIDNHGPVRVFGEHMIVKSGEYKLRDMLDMALLQLRNDGVIEGLTKKYAKQFETTIRAPAKDVTE